MDTDNKLVFNMEYDDGFDETQVLNFKNYSQDENLIRHMQDTHGGELVEMITRFCAGGEKVRIVHWIDDVDERFFVTVTVKEEIQ